MKKYEGVLKRVREVEEKRNIKYLNTDSRIYIAIRVLYILTLIWSTFTNLVFLLGHLIIYSDNADVVEFRNRIITVTVGGILLIAGAVLNHFKIYIISFLISLISAVFLNLNYARLLPDDFGFLGLKTSFYVRHFIPMTLLTVFLLCLTLIAVRARIKTNSMYKKITENLYKTYNISGAEAGNITDEEWEEFLKNYDPDNKS